MLTIFIMQVVLKKGSLLDSVHWYPKARPKFTTKVMDNVLTDENSCGQKSMVSMANEACHGQQSMSKVVANEAFHGQQSNYLMEFLQLTPGKKNVWQHQTHFHGKYVHHIVSGRRMWIGDIDLVTGKIKVWCPEQHKYEWRKGHMYNMTAKL